MQWKHKRESNASPFSAAARRDDGVPADARPSIRDGMTVETRFPHIDSLTCGSPGRPVVVVRDIVHSRISDVDQDIVAYRSGLEFVE
jgi:hypothetical protein